LLRHGRKYLDELDDRRSGRIFCEIVPESAQNVIIDKGSKFYVETIRELLGKEAFQVEVASSDGLRNKDASPYQYVVIYGEVMAFTMKSAVKKWVKAQKSLENKKLLVFVTASRWFNEKLRKDLVTLAEKKRATVVDAVSMATKKATEAEKHEKIRALIATLKK
jgi:putative aminopeptidase FrvX